MYTLKEACSCLKRGIKTKMLPYDSSLMTKKNVCALLKEAYDAKANNPEQINAAFLQTLGRIIKSSGINISWLSKKTGISKQHLYRLMKGQKNPTIDTLRTIFDELEIEINFVKKQNP